MTLFGIAMIVIGILVAVKVVGLVIRLAMVVLVLIGLYLILAPMLGGG